MHGGDDTGVQRANNEDGRDRGACVGIRRSNMKKCGE